MICPVHGILLKWKVKENQADKICVERREIHVTFYSGKLEMERPGQRLVL
jgi:hypothetical protein